MSSNIMILTIITNNIIINSNISSYFCTLWFIKFNEEDSNRESVFILYLIIKNKLTPNLKERGWNGYL